VSAFTVGAITAKLRLNIGEWRRSVTNVMRDGHRMRNSTTGVLHQVMALTRSFGLLGAVGTYAYQRLGRSMIQAASTMENFRMTLRLLLRSGEEANKMILDMGDISRTVPFEYEHVIKGAIQLSAVLKGNTDDVRAWTPLILDLASVLAPLGVSLEETTVQFIRMYSAGAAAADLFREKGVLAMLGFNPGEMISVMETRKRLYEEWAKEDSMFRGASAELAKTWTGQISVMKDIWWQFRVALMEAGMFDNLRAGLIAFTGALANNWTGIRAWLDENGKMVGNVVMVAGALALLSVGIGAISLAMPLFIQMWEMTNVVLSRSGLRVMGVVLILGVLVGAVYSISASVRKNVGGMGDDWNWLADTVASVFNFIKTSALSLAKSVSEYLTPMFNKIIGGAFAAVEAVKLLAQVATFQGVDLEKGLKDIKHAFNDDYSGALHSMFVAGSEFVYEELEKNGEVAKDQFQKDLDDLIATATEKYPLLVSLLKDMRDGVASEGGRTDNFFGKLPSFGGDIPDTNGAAKALKQYQLELQAAIKMRQSVMPIEALGQDLADLDEMARKFPQIIDQEAAFSKMKDLWDSYRDRGISINTDITKATSLLGDKMQAIWREAQMEQEEYLMSLDSIKQHSVEVDPNIGEGMQLLEQLGARALVIGELERQINLVKTAIQSLKDNGTITDLEADNLLREEYWLRLSNTVRMSLDELVEAIQDPGLSPEAFDVLSAAIKEKLKEELGDATISANKLSAAFDQMGMRLAANLVSTMTTVVTNVMQIIQLVRALPAFFGAMSVAGVSAAVVIGAAMLIAFHIFALIMQAIAAIIGLFQSLGNESEKELKGMGKVIQEIKEQSQQWIDGLTDSIVEFARTGKQTFKEFADSVLDDLLSIALAELVIRPGVSFIGSQLFAKGGVFQNGNVTKFAGGGVVNKPTSFPMKNGSGLMGEAGPEAIMPLRRMGNGRLGVESGGQAPGVTVNVHATGLPPENVSVESSRSSDGGQVLDIYVKNVVRRGLQDGTFARDLSAFYGLTRRPV
jgi:tetratricopeptide (TPR) repeat protein